MTRTEKENILKKYAFRHLGKPYRYGAKPYHAPKEFDCSGFVQYLYRRINIDLPRTTIQQAHRGRRVKSRDPKKLKTGDLIFCRGSKGYFDKEFPKGIGHVLMYVGDEKVIHAKSIEKNGREKGRVTIEPAKKWLARKDLTIIKRVI